MDRIISALGHVSRLINRALGGERDCTLCARVAMAWGDDCWFCRLISLALADPQHCADERERWLSRRD